MARQKLRDSAWICGLEKTKAINPGRSLRELSEKTGTDERQLWGEDPVHSEREGYQAIAEEIVKAATTATAPAVRPKRASDHSSHGDRKRLQWTRGRGSVPWNQRGRPERGHSLSRTLRLQRGFKRGPRRPY